LKTIESFIVNLYNEELNKLYRLSNTIFFRLKRLVREDDHSRPSSAKVKSVYAVNSLPPLRIHTYCYGTEVPCYSSAYPSIQSICVSSKKCGIIQIACRIGLDIHHVVLFFHKNNNGTISSLYLPILGKGRINKVTWTTNVIFVPIDLYQH
jgi:hypothetical protein